MSAFIITVSRLWNAFVPPQVAWSNIDQTQYSKLEEVTSQLNSLQEALKSRSDPQNLHVQTHETRKSRTVTPDAVVGLVRPPSITVDSSHAIDDNGVSFFGIEDSVNSALAIGDQTLGMQKTKYVRLYLIY